MTPLSHERSEEEATAFLAAFKARTDGHAPLFTSEKLPAYVAALIANYSTPEPPPAQRGRGRPRQTPRRVLDATLLYAQVDEGSRYFYTTPDRGIAASLQDLTRLFTGKPAREAWSKGIAGV